MADAADTARLSTLVTTQAGLFEELKAAYTEQEAIREGIESASRRIADLEGQLKERATTEERWAAIAEILRPRQQTPTKQPIV